MALGWNEIRAKAREFAFEWQDEASESAEAKTFWDDFFRVFGVDRRRLAQFEKAVQKTDGKHGRIDLFWTGKLLVEHKSKGKSLDKAESQAFGYLSGLSKGELPRYILLSDFARFRLFDLDKDEAYDVELSKLPDSIELFGFIAGYEAQPVAEQDPVNLKAAEKLGAIHDILFDSGYRGHQLEVYLVRLLFCCFAEDTSIFSPGAFRNFIENECDGAGKDLGINLNLLFQILNTSDDSPARNYHPASYTPFRYVNGKLFEEVVIIPPTNAKMRQLLLECCELDWTRISPAIFGSLFQSIMDKTKRRNLGAHYTSEGNILKALGPLFLDKLHKQLNACGRSKAKLEAFQKKLGKIRVLDPACGCGNFLVIAYRELRRLELDVLARLNTKKGVLFVKNLIHVDVDQFYGIEIEEFPAQIAQVALWLTDHQMNMEAWVRFGAEFFRLPLQAAPSIHHANALTLDWREVVAPAELSYIVGNPPFVGARMVKRIQGGRLRRELTTVFGNIRGHGNLDYVACWYILAARYMQENTAIRTAFVSTNSISQGEQPGILWPQLFGLGARINFAHRTFQWDSEASGKAAVHCVIVGFALEDELPKQLYDYDSVKGDPHMHEVARINPYLVDGPNVLLSSRSKPIDQAPKLGIGNQAIDDGNYLFTNAEKEAFLQKEPQAEPFFRPWVGSEEFINGEYRWCLWLGRATPSELRQMPLSMARVDATRAYRLKSTRSQTLKLAKTPRNFQVEVLPEAAYLVIPEVSSERRAFIPIGFLNSNVMASHLVRVAPDATIYDFGILTSTMHMAWVRALAGRLESRYRYSIKIVYNNYPWPDAPSAKQIAAIEAAAQNVLDVRGQFPAETLANLYDPNLMPAALTKAHRKLDQAVDKAYRRAAFKSEPERVAYLLERYAELSGAQLFDV